MKKSCFDGVRKALSVNLPGIPFISKWLVPIHRLYLLLCCITKEEANDHTKNLLSILCFPGRSCCPANRPHSHWMPGFTCRPEIFTTIQQNISAWDESLPDTMLFFFLLPLVLFHSTNIPQPGTGLGAGNAGWIAEPRSPFPWSCSLQNISPSISRTLSLGGREGHHCNSHFLDDETNNCLSIFAPGYEVIGLD